MRSMTVLAASGAVRQSGWPNDHPIAVVLFNQFFLSQPIPEIEWQNERDDKQGREKAKAAHGIADAKRGFTHQTRHSTSFHRLQDVVSPPRENPAWIKPAFVSEGTDNGILTLHRRFDR